MIVKFPDRAFRRREASRRRRNSKNGAPEERASTVAWPVHPRKQRRSKNGTPEERAAKLAAMSAKIIPLVPRASVRKPEQSSEDGGAISA